MVQHTLEPRSPRQNPCLQQRGRHPAERADSLKGAVAGDFVHAHLKAKGCNTAILSRRQLVRVHQGYLGSMKLVYRKIRNLDKDVDFSVL